MDRFKPEKVCVVGCGYVGLVTGACLAEIGHDVTCVDNDEGKVALLKEGKVPIYEQELDELIERGAAAGRLRFTDTVEKGMDGARIVFIAVGTPPCQDGSADLTYVEAVAREIAANLKHYTVIVEKSTVPVETGEEVERAVVRYNRNLVPFDVVSNPEFLREGSAIQDFLHPDRIVIGSKSKQAEEVMCGLYAPLNARMVLTDLKSAELIKHASNSFLAMKISYMNGVGRICEAVGADVTKVAEGMGLDPRIGRAFLHAGIGFGGFCLPKDVEAFLYISRKVGYNFDLLRVVREINDRQRDHFIEKIRSALWVLRGKTIAVLGVAFKPDTDDIRFAPSLDIIAQLQAQGATVRVYDPVAMERARPVLQGAVFCSDAYEAAAVADCIAIVTEWAEFADLDYVRIRDSMTHPIIVDGRNMLDSNAMRSLGFEYHGMGR